MPCGSVLSCDEIEVRTTSKWLSGSRMVDGAYYIVAKPEVHCALDVNHIASVLERKTEELLRGKTWGSKSPGIWVPHTT